jgi:integrase
LVLILTGLRREEALNLKWTNVDLVGRTLTVIDPKNRNDHLLPLSDFLYELLVSRREVTVSQYVFADSSGARISNFRYALAAVEKVSGVRATPHDLRRTFSTIAESLKFSPWAIKRLLNHTIDSDVTGGYIIFTLDELQGMMQQITDYILKAAGIKATAEVVYLNVAGSIGP